LYSERSRTYTVDWLKMHLFSGVSAVQVQGAVGRYCCWCAWDAVGSRAEYLLAATAGIQYVQAQGLGLAGDLCRSLRTAGWVKAELSSCSQGYTRLPASRCVLASARGSRSPREGARLSGSRAESFGRNG